MEVLREKFENSAFSHFLVHDEKENSILYNYVEGSLSFLKKAPKKAEENRGSLTIAALTINMKNLHMNSYLLGDCAFLIIRDSKIFFRSEDMLRKWNTPYQLGIGGPRDMLDHPMFGSEKSFQLQYNDVIVIGSDGVFDNVFDKHVLNIVNWYTMEEWSKDEIARRIAKHLVVQAKQIGMTRRKVKTPYSEGVLKELGKKMSGGKIDDTTAVVAIVGYD